MAHMMNVRRIRNRLSGSLETEIPMTLGGNNFAVFGGTAEQRRYSCLRAISRFCGRCGVIVLHDDPVLEQNMLALPYALAGQSQQPAAFRVHAGSSKCYDPLYGLDEDAIVNLFLPNSETSLDPAVQQIRAGLLAYLTVMDASYRRNPQLHGRHPYNLDMLMQLVQMPFQELDERVLSHLPEQTGSFVRPILNRPGMQQNVHSTVLPYATVMAKYYWSPSGIQGHTRISIVQAVEERQIICLRIPQSRQTLMDHLCADLQMLADRGLPFLLVSSSLDVPVSSRLSGWLLGVDDSGKYYAGIVAKDMKSVAPTHNEESCVLTRYDQILVYRCNNVSQADPFTRAYGYYERRQTDETAQTFFSPTRLIPSLSSGTQVRRVEELNVRAEELVHLRNGVFLCGNYYPIPVLVRNFSMTGGEQLGLPMP